MFEQSGSPGHLGDRYQKLLARQAEYAFGHNVVLRMRLGAGRAAQLTAFFSASRGGGLEQGFTGTGHCRFLKCSLFQRAFSFSRLFRSALGMGFAEWRRQVQLATAVAEIIQGVPVSRIARSQGYSPSSFSDMFRRELGVAPSQYGVGCSKSGGINLDW